MGTVHGWAALKRPQAPLTCGAHREWRRKTPDADLAILEQQVTWQSSNKPVRGIFDRKNAEETEARDGSLPNQFP